MQPLFFITQNSNKFTETQNILGCTLNQVSLDLLEPQEAVDAFNRLGKPALVEDASLECKVWNGLPGALIKWFLKSVGNEGILRMLKNETDRSAIAKTVFAVFDSSVVKIFLGEVDGSIANELRGSSAFGWDKIFIPDGQEKNICGNDAQREK